MPGRSRQAQRSARRGSSGSSSDARAEPLPGVGVVGQLGEPAQQEQLVDRGRSPATLEIEAGQHQVEVDVARGDGQGEVTGVDRGEGAAGAAVGGCRGEQAVAGGRGVAPGEGFLCRATDDERVDLGLRFRFRLRFGLRLCLRAGLAPFIEHLRRDDGRLLDRSRFGFDRLRRRLGGRLRLGFGHRLGLDGLRIGRLRLLRFRFRLDDNGGRRCPDRWLEHPEHLGQRLGHRRVGRCGLEPSRVSLDLAAALPGFGELEGPPGGVARVGQAAGSVEHLGEAVEQIGGLDTTPGRSQQVGLTAERGLVARRQGERSCIRLRRVGRPAHLQEDAADRGVRQRPVGGDRGRFAVRPDRRLIPAAQRRDMAAPERVLVALVQRVRRGGRRLLFGSVSHRSPRRAAPSGRGDGSRTGPR